MRFLSAFFLAAVAVISGCGDVADSAANGHAPFVKTWVLESGSPGSLSLSGTVRAQVESPLAFQVAGRIVQRAVNAGQIVRADDTLFRLDTRDLEQGVQEAQAAFEAAQAARRIAQDDLKRHQQLLVHNAVSRQAAEQAELMVREAQARASAAQARLKQARNALSYATLAAPASGVLIDMTAEVGQVVAAGQPVAVLAHEGARDVQVYVPEGRVPPAQAVLNTAGQTVLLPLREAAGAVDTQSRTLRARYSVPADAPELQLGSVVRVGFLDDQAGPQTSFVVPVAAVSERGQGAQVWRLRDGKVTPVAVTLLGMDAETARIAGALQAGDVVVALGTHLLQDGMVVREHQK